MKNLGSRKLFVTLLPFLAVAITLSILLAIAGEARAASASIQPPAHDPITVVSTVRGRGTDIQYHFEYTLEFTPNVADSIQHSNAFISQNVTFLDTGDYSGKDKVVYIDDVKGQNILSAGKKTYNYYFTGGENGKFFSVSEGMKWSGKIEKQPSGEYFAVITGMDVSPVYIKLPSDTFSDNGPISNFDYR